MNPASPTWLLQFALCAYGVGAFGSLLAARRDKLANLIGFGSATVASLGGLGAALLALTAEPAVEAATFELWPSLIPSVKLAVKLDPLSAFFLLIVSLLALALSIYSFGYVRGFYGRKSVGALGAFYNALLLATTLVFTASNALFFLIAWELMALTAYCLVSFEHEQAETRNAGVLFFIMSHIGTGCLILGFLLLFQASGQALGTFGADAYSFEGFRTLGSNLSPGRRDAAFLLFVFGFGVKAGIVPLHVWLPVAHPVAPSNASALLSGVDCGSSKGRVTTVPCAISLASRFFARGVVSRVALALSGVTPSNKEVTINALPSANHVAR